jgi:hypothetical protein
MDGWIVPKIENIVAQSVSKCFFSAVCGWIVLKFGGDLQVNLLFLLLLFSLLSSSSNSSFFSSFSWGFAFICIY